jgi:hypothetical protein
MADDKRKPASKRASAGTGAKGAAGGASRGGGTRGSSGAGRGTSTASSRSATDTGAANGGASGAERRGSGPRRPQRAPGDHAGRTSTGRTPRRRPGAGDDTAPAAAELGGGTADGDGLTAAALTASRLDDEALGDASESFVVVESLTVLTETPLAGADRAMAEPVDAQQRWLMIAERAYLLAAARGFAPGGELEDWLSAEQEVDARLDGG